uniref:Uncharacterized protein n=1 Tax=Zea mays TaxID=4577 RepID=A0A804QMG3_MAIZE
MPASSAPPHRPPTSHLLPPLYCLRLSVIRPSATVVIPPPSVHPPPRVHPPPWRDEWRMHPMVGATPRLSICIVAFRIYLVSEASYNCLYRPSGDHHH